MDRSKPTTSLPVRTAHVIWNPVSGPSRRGDTGPEVREILAQAGIEAELARTEAPGHARALARDACIKERDAIVVVGGDGTVNEVINGLIGGRAALASVPTGTSNILAREIGIPLAPHQAARLIAGGRRRRMDTGLANGRRFLAVVGVGWDAHVVDAVAGRRTGHLGKHRYVLPVIEAMLRYGFPPLDVRIDGEVSPRRVSLAFVCNTRNYAAWFRIAPRAVPDDGRLDFLLIREGRSRNCLRWGIAALRGTLPNYREVDCVRGRRVRIESEQPVPYQIDGDPGGHTPLTVEIEEGALEVIVP